MIKLLFLSVSFFLVISVYPQSIIQKKISLSGQILCNKNKKHLPYANIYNLSQGTGTVSNQLGRFILNGNNEKDKVRISFVGYKDTIIVVSENSPEHIYLNPSTEVIDEILVLSDIDYLYELISAVRQKYLKEHVIDKKANHREAKTYFQLETFHKKNQVELIEAYYNGNYDTYDLSTLNLKKGRVGIKPDSANYYISSETSKTFFQHNLFKSDYHFPVQPLQLTKRKLRKRFQVQIVRVFNEDNQRIFVIDFTPKKGFESYFNGRIWINKEEKTIRKITLKKNNSDIHPFLPFGTLNKINKVDLLITKTFQNINDKAFVNTIDFYYTIKGEDYTGVSKSFQTKALIKAYDYHSAFTLPLFTYSNSMYKDYRDISATPYDSIFWSAIREFSFDAEYKKKNKFIEENLLWTVNKDLTFLTPKKSILQFAYNTWSPERIIIKDINQEGTVILPNQTVYIDPTYNINTKIYADFNKTTDTSYFQCFAILDPVNTFYNYEMTENSKAFINMYFDIVEIYKKQLVEKVTNSGITDIKQLKIMYDNTLTEMFIKLKLYTKEVFHGQNIDKMKKWDKFIYKELGISNFSLFGLAEAESMAK